MNLIVDQIRNSIVTIDREPGLLDQEIEHFESQGLRVVKLEHASETGSAYVVRDHRTGETLGEYDDNRPGNENWIYIDYIYDEVSACNEVPKVKELPDSLISALDDWVYQNLEEARELVTRF